ncbi:MAG: hypothetical protein CHACPFDD_03318 [Phycisphaerae bacterium]|nr:hypothetical protein [Phycisphaerae bacterium]
MIDALKDDDIIEKVGGRFKLAALIQKRWLEILQGSRPMVEPAGQTVIEVVLEEIRSGKLTFEAKGDGISGSNLG